MPPQNHIINGHVYTAGEVPLSNATVLFTHISSGETITKTTNASAEYSLNLFDISSWTVDDEITIKALKSYFGQKTVSTTISSGPAQTHDIILEYVSDMLIDTGDRKWIKENAALLVDFEGNKITPSNPIPVKIMESSADPLAFDIDNNPSVEYALNGDGTANTLTITFTSGRYKNQQYQRTYTYSGGVPTGHSAWVKI